MESNSQLLTRIFQKCYTHPIKGGIHLKNGEGGTKHTFHHLFTTSSNLHTVHNYTTFQLINTVKPRYSGHRRDRTCCPLYRGVRPRGGPSFNVTSQDKIWRRPYGLCQLVHGLLWSEEDHITVGLCVRVSVCPNCVCEQLFSEVAEGISTKFHTNIQQVV